MKQKLSDIPYYKVLGMEWFWILDLLWECIKTVGLLGIRESNSHSWGQRRMKNDSSTLIPSSKIHRWHCSYALAINNHIFRADAVSKKFASLKDIVRNIPLFLRFATESLIMRQCHFTFKNLNFLAIIFNVITSSILWISSCSILIF